MRKTKSLLLGGIAVSLATNISRGVSLYDSGGFEAAAGFSTTGGSTSPSSGTGGPGLYNQSGTDLPEFSIATTQANAAGASFAKIETSVAYAGSQAVQFTRLSTDVDTYYAPILSYTYTPGVTPGSQATVDIAWAMNVSSSATNDPFFGITAANGNDTLAVAGIDANVGDVVYQNAAGFSAVPLGSLLNKWDTFDLKLNYAAQTESLFVNGAFVESGGFASGVTEDGFTDADISSLAPNAQDSAAGTAYFDNYTISAVPEPGSMTILGIAAVGTLSRRKRQPIV